MAINDVIAAIDGIIGIIEFSDCVIGGG